MLDVGRARLDIALVLLVQAHHPPCYCGPQPLAVVEADLQPLALLVLLSQDLLLVLLVLLVPQVQGESDPLVLLVQEEADLQPRALHRDVKALWQLDWVRRFLPVWLHC